METNIELLNINEAAKLLRLEVSSLRGLVGRKKIPYTKPYGSILFVKADLLKWIEENKVTPENKK